ncbi:MAG: hemerythrin domain-containing protein [Elusimicrobia bacterium]|nr:hemerythrin domain-containing protein [Elusimicrobiota bacterium]
MKITDRLQSDHMSLFSVLEDLREWSGKTDRPEQSWKAACLVDLLRGQLAVHSWFEDAIFFPAILEGLMKAGPQGCPPRAIELLKEDHRQIEVRLRRLEEAVRAGSDGTAWLPALEDCRKVMLAHIQKEEGELFPLSEKVLGEAALESLSQQMMSADMKRVKVPDRLSALRSEDGQT